MKKIYLIVSITVIINLILIIFIIFPLINSIKNISKDLVSQNSEIFLLEQREDNLKNLKKIYNSNQKNLEKIDASSVNLNTPIGFIGFLEKIAVDSQAGVEISLTEGKSSFENSLLFSVSLGSSFPNFLKFLEKLENGPYFIEVSSLNIRRTIEGEISAVLTFSVLAKE
ncbi:hypothetical protein IH779_00570 [Patescibacteria group bacterium]|nr:hypothetical protein [Patescibacteria group bacterium]